MYNITSPQFDFKIPSINMIKPLKHSLALLIPCAAMFSFACSEAKSGEEKKTEVATTTNEPVKPGIDTAVFDKLIKAHANGDTTGKWPTKLPYPLAGALLPYNRIVAYYGNLYSKKMGVLGEYPKAEMLQKLKAEVAKWQAADTSIPVIPALHYVAVTAQGAAGKDGKHRMRMPFHQIDSIVNWSNEIKGLAFVDIQVGHSSVKAEVPELEKYLKMPNVHLGIDPEFSMKGGEVPGSKNRNL